MDNDSIIKEKLLEYFKGIGKLPEYFTINDLKKYSKQNMIDLSKIEGFHKNYYIFFRDLKKSGLFKKSDFIDETGKFNSDIFFKIIDIKIIFLFFISYHNEEINKNFEIHDNYDLPTSYDSYTSSLSECINEYDRFVFRIVYLSIVDEFSKPEMFIDINKQILGKNILDQNSAEIFSLKYKIYIENVNKTDNNIKWSDTPLSDDSKSEELEDKSSKLFERYDNPMMKLLECLKKKSEKDCHNCRDCRNCDTILGTSRYPFMIVRKGVEFTLIDVARNFYLIDCDSNKKLETNTKLEIDKIYTINYGTSTIVFKIIKKD